MASKKKRNRPRPPAGGRPAAKPSPTTGTAKAPAGAAKARGAAPAPAGKAKAGGAGPAASTAKAAPSKPSREGKMTRAERLAAAEAARRRKALRTRALVAGALAALLTLITVTVVNSRRSNDRVVQALEESGKCEYDSRSDTDRGPGRNHVSGDIRYEVDPPSGGNHAPSAASAGVFTMESKPSDPLIVHALEHGYVTLWHRPDVDASVVDELRALAGRHNRDVLVVPRESLKVPVAATAWHRRLLCTQSDIPALERFVTEYRNEGPEDVEH